MAKIQEEMLNDEDKKLTKEQTYDSALAAMVSKLRTYVVPLVNEVFGEKFTQEAEVALQNNKHVIRRVDDSLARRDNDLVVQLTEVIEKLIKKTYMFECETWYDDSIVLRIAEYGTSVAIENPEITTNGVILNLPNSAVIFLKPNRAIPRVMKITFRGPNGAEMSYEVPSLQVKDYTVDELFSKKLLILLPFYLFRFANDFDEMEENAIKRKEINSALNEILIRLDALMERKEITAYQKLTIQSLLKRVSDRLMARYENLKKEVDEIMSGAIARTKADDILEQGQQEAMSLINFLLAKGKTDDVQKVSSDKGYFKELLAKFKRGELA